MDNPSFNKLKNLLLNRVSETLCVDKEKIQGSCSEPRVVWARWIVWYILKSYFHLSYAEVAKLIGDASRHSSLYGLKRLPYMLHKEQWVNGAFIDILQFVDDNGFTGIPVVTPKEEDSLSEDAVKRKVKRITKSKLISKQLT